VIFTNVKVDAVNASTQMVEMEYSVQTPTLKDTIALINITLHALIGISVLKILLRQNKLSIRELI
jgi:hypothetical protein